MKKIVVSILIFILSFVLAGCDYDEKSFQALNRDEIPTEVTRDFQLPKGIYGKFIWESDSDALIIAGNKVTVNQKDEDTLVTLTATINKKSENFQVKVLKTGSDRAWREKAEDAHVSLQSLYTQIDENNLKLPKRYEDLYIRYYFDDSLGNYGYFEDEDCYYISSGFNAENKNISINLSFYKESDFNIDDNYINYRGSLSLYAKKLNQDDIYLETLKEININNYYKSFKFNFYLNVNDYIEFGDSDNYDIKLEFYNNDTLKKITETKYQLIKPVEGTLYEKGYLTITINNMPKRILITVYNSKN